jgi:hypothetical protein
MRFVTQLDAKVGFLGGLPDRFRGRDGGPGEKGHKKTILLVQDATTL